MKLLYLHLLCLFFNVTFAQLNHVRSIQSWQALTLNERLDSYNIFQADDLKLSPISPSKSLLSSLILPGLGQYLNDDEIMPFIYLGIEVASWSAYFAYNKQGDSRTTDVENFANNKENGFNRVRYYKNIAEGSPIDLSNINLDGDEEVEYQKILNGPHWLALKAREKDIGDGVHSLPETKTQQYYELIGKYTWFYHGWKYFGSEYTVDNWRNIQSTPAYIRTYYDKRDLMNASYKKATFAVSIVLVNHLVSAIEAYITAKKHLSLTSSVINNNNELVNMVNITYEF